VLFATTSLGIFMATLSRNMPQFGMLVVLVLLPLQMLSGGNTPRESMPKFVQDVMLAARRRILSNWAMPSCFAGRVCQSSGRTCWPPRPSALSFCDRPGPFPQDDLGDGMGGIFRCRQGQDLRLSARGHFKGNKEKLMKKQIVLIGLLPAILLSACVSDGYGGQGRPDVPTTGMHIAMIQLTRVSDAMNQDRLGTATAFIAISKAAITASEATALLARLWALWLAARLETSSLPAAPRRWAHC
jgi:hypothetical protein